MRAERADYKVALDLATKDGDDRLKVQVKQLLHALNDQFPTK